MLRVALLNGCKHNYDHDITKLIGSLINGDCVVNGLEVTAGQVSAGYGFIEAIRTATGDSALVLVSLTEDDTSLDTSGTKKVWIALDQSMIDDASLISENQDNIASIQTGGAYPPTPHIKLAGISDGTISDERVFISLKQGVNKTLTETITGLKYFSLFPQKSGSLTPVNDGDFATKKYIDDLVAQAGAIERLEVLRTLGEDLSQDDTYFVGRGGESFDHTGTTLNLLVGDSASNLVRYLYIENSSVSGILRRVRDMRINTQGTPSATLTISAVSSDGSETELISTASGLQLDTEIDLQVDVETVKLKFEASTNDGSNYYQVQVTSGTISEIESDEITYDIETVDSSNWTTYQERTIETLTQITDIAFDFQSTYSYYAGEMDWRVLKNGVVVHGPVSSGLGNTSAYTTLSATGLSIGLSPGDTISLQMMTPNNRSGSYYYRAKNFTLTGSGSYLAGHHDRGYESGKKYLAKGSIPARAYFDGFESTGGIEGAQTEGVEAGKYNLSFLGPVFLDDTGGLTTTKKDIYVGQGKGDEVEIVRDRGRSVLEYMQDHGYSLVAGETIINIDTSYDYSSLDTHTKVYEVEIQKDGTYRFASEIRSGNSSTSVYSYMGLYKNDVYISEVNTNLDSYDYKYIDHACVKGDKMSLRHRTNNVSYQSSIRNKSVRTAGFIPSVTVL